MKRLIDQYWRAAAITLVVAGLMLMALSGVLAPVIRVGLDPVVAAQTWFATRYLTVYNLLRSPGELTSLRAQNDSLATENALLKTEIVQLREQQKDFSTLYALLRIARSRPDSETIAAMVIGRDPSPFLRYIYINQGSDAGLRRGMPVVTAEGLAGRVVAVTAAAAQVQLITDASSAVNVRLPDSGADAVLTGSVTGDLTLEMIPQIADIKQGEMILTSGLGGEYPANLLAGQVVGVRKLETALFQSAAVQPVTDFEGLRWVLVVLNFTPIDLTPLQSGGTP